MWGNPNPRPRAHIPGARIISSSSLGSPDEPNNDDVDEEGEDGRVRKKKIDEGADLGLSIAAKPQGLLLASLLNH